MNPKVPNSRVMRLARWLLAAESSAGPDLSSNPPPLEVYRVSDKLRRPLSSLAGTSGFQALLARALALTKTQAPVFQSLRVSLDGSLEGLNDVVRDAKSTEAGVLLIAKLLEILIMFIGEHLVLQLVMDVWPDLPALEPESTGRREL